MNHGPSKKMENERLLNVKTPSSSNDALFIKKTCLPFYEFDKLFMWHTNPLIKNSGFFDVIAIDNDSDDKR